MFKTVKWRSEKKKIKAVFKLQFRVTQVPQRDWDALMVTLVSADLGKPNLRSDKSAIVDGICQWMNPSYQTVKFTQELRTGKINDKVHKFIVSATGLSKTEVLGEININLANYAKVFIPTSVSLPLQDSNNGAILHVTIQRVQDHVGERETDENGDIQNETTVNKDTFVEQGQKKTLRSQLSTPEPEEEKEVTKGTNDVATGEGSFIKLLNTHSNRNILLQEYLSGDLNKSNSFDGISASGSESSLGQYTPLSRVKNSNFPDSHQENARSLSTLSNADWRVTSTNCTGETEIKDALEKQKSDLDNKSINLQVSDLELQTLRKQVIKEKRRVQDIFRELSSIKEERDVLRKECEELKAYKKIATTDESISTATELQCTTDSDSMLVKTEEDTRDSNLTSQMKEIQESNTELILTVRDLEEQLEQKSMEMSCTLEDTQEITNNNHLSCFRNSEDKLNEEHDEIITCTQEEKIFYLKSELELYKKDREDQQVHMEQLALDYEILKQENHNISSRLENAQLQLRMQYECSTHAAIINDLEDHVEILEKELEKQAIEYETNLATVTQTKVEQEQRAIQAEEELRKTRWTNANAVENIQDEFKRFTSQLLTTFYSNEEVVIRTLEESRELRLENFYLQTLLKESNEKLSSLESQHQVKCKQLLSLMDFKAKEVDRLLQENKDNVEKINASTKEIEMLLQERNLERTLLDEEIYMSKEEAKKTVEELKELRQLKNEQDAMIKTLNSKLQTMKTQHTELKNCLSGDELEKENLRKQVMLLRGDLKKEADIITKIEKRLKDNNANLRVSEGTMAYIRNKSKRSLQAACDSQIVHKLKWESKRNDENNDINMILNDDNLGDSDESIRRNLDAPTNTEEENLISCTKEQTKLADLQSEMATLKERNESMEAELNGTREKFSEMSMKLARVEGEKQQLVIRVRTLKYSMKN